MTASEDGPSDRAPLSDSGHAREEVLVRLDGVLQGKDVEIVQTGDNSYRITIPEFIYLGYSDPDLSVADEENGILSWTTPEIDTSEIFEELLSSQVVSEHIDGFRSVLEEQAKTFYTKIVTAIDPDIVLDFTFAE
ncbi:hypothetical protein [Microbacterium lacticum]